MPEQHLLPIALPRGRIGDTGYLTVYYAPRLKEPGVLNDYPAWMRWPDTLNRLTIQVGLSDELTNGWVPPTQVGITPDPAKWASTFRGTTPIKPHRFIDWSQTPLQTVATSDFSEAVLDLYTSIAAGHPTHPPSGLDLLAIPQATVLTDRDSTLDETVAYLQPMEGESEGERLEEICGQDPAACEPDWDFHEYVSLLGAHPEVLRHLGIAVDYEFQFPTDPTKPTKPTSVTVRTNYEVLFGQKGAREVRIITRTTDDFLAASNPDPTYKEQVGGFLQFEKQGAFLSILDTYSTAGRLNRLDERVADRAAPLPALTTRALTLVRPDLLAAFANRTKRQAEIEGAVRDYLDQVGGPVEVYAEDVSIGHRIDVLHLSDPAGGTWRSLFERKADANGYQFPHDPTLNLTPEPDEGWTETVLVTEIDEQLPQPDPDRDDPIQPYVLRRLDDQLYRWDGWSGAVRPPGGAIDGTTGTTAKTGPDLPASDAYVQFAANYEVMPASLPGLRFGDPYQMRARCVDLAGNSVALSTATPAGAETPIEIFGRLEPIAAPFVIRRTERPVPGVGDDALTVVLLSDYDIDDAKVERRERLMFPGRVGPDLCELHGEPNGGADPASYEVLADRDAKAPQDQWSLDPVTGEPVAQGEPRQAVAYLSDPFIGQLRAYRYGQNGGEYLVDLTGTWPAFTSARLEVVAGEGATEVNPDAITDLRFFVEKADIVAVDLSYAPSAGDIHTFGLWHRLPAADQDALKATIERGGHWMFSARRPIRLVHAVRRPLLAPRVETWSHSREDDSTGITIATTLQADRRSTGQVTLHARWTDFIDDLNQAGPAPRDGGARLGRFTTPRLTGTQFTIKAHRSELGDTKRHAATIDIEAFSSFSSYFTEERVVTVVRGPIEVDNRGFADGSVSVRFGDDNTEARPDIDYKIDTKAGKLKRVKGSVLKIGSDVTIRYIPLPVSRTSDEYPAFEVVLPNTATPPPPGVDSVIPAFKRTHPDAKQVTHDGRLLRVYLKRPWNVTGDGESLAVLVERSPGAVANASRIGRDPIVAGAVSLAPLAVTAFTAAYESVVNYDGIHDLALHAVEYDGASGRWFADIAVETNAYRPFLQLVIACYQADSIDGKQLGPTVMLEPVRLGVSRSVTVSPQDDGYEVVVTGIEHNGIPVDKVSSAQNEVTVTLQQADLNIADADLRWLTDLEVVVLQRSATSDGTSSWSGHVAVEESDTLQRFVIEESEPALFGGENPDLVGNVVYTEVVALAAP